MEGDVVILNNDNFIYQGAIYRGDKLYYNSENGIIILNNLDEYIQYRCPHLNQNHIAIRRRRTWFIFYNQILHMVLEKTYPLEKYFIADDMIASKNKKNTRYISYEHQNNVLIYENFKFYNLLDALIYVYGSSSVSKYNIVRGIKHIDMKNIIPKMENVIMGKYTI